MWFVIMGIFLAWFLETILISLPYKARSEALVLKTVSIELDAELTGGNIKSPC